MWPLHSRAQSLGRPVDAVTVSTRMDIAGPAKFRDGLPLHPAVPKAKAAAKSSAVRRFGEIRRERR